ncbi:MAG: hypothetical protein MUE92_11630 [Chloroflexi bacterium]|nr:hypothetical protein [Chloroflexota bacterium]
MANRTPAPAGPMVVARRWDGLGGRLHALLNAWSIARALDLECRFVWPRNAFTALSRPRELFDDAFLARFEIPEAACADRVAQPDPTASSLPEARARCRVAGPLAMIDVAECFEVSAFAGEPAGEAAERFRAGFGEIGWSVAVREIVASGWASPEYSAVHARAGDIVDGAWRQFVPVEKYVPTAYVEHAVEALGGPGALPVVVVSDNEAYVGDLKARFEHVRSPGDLVPGYAGLSEAQRALADVLVLSRARSIFGPRTSAFSRLAAHLGDVDARCIGDVTTESGARRRLRDGIARAAGAAARRTVLRPLLARDACWFLDVFSDALPLSDHLALARRATRLDPNFCGALNRLATALALAGRSGASADASSRALRLAARAEVHADPLVESVATSISAGVLLALDGRRDRVRRLLGRLGLSLRFGRSGGGHRETALEGMTKSLERCESLAPFQTHHHDVLANLRFQLAALAWLDRAGAGLRDAAGRAMGRFEGGPLLSPSWRPSGFSRLRGTGSYPQTLRNVEIVTLRVAQALGAALSSAPSRPLRTGRVDTIRAGPSGLRWAGGWAYDAEAGRADLAVGFASNEGVAVAGATFLPRPDVAAALGDPRALRSGFELPVPSAVPDDRAALEAILRVCSPSR